MACEDKKDCSVEGKNVADFPFADLKMLLDTILGNKPFDLFEVIAALSRVTEYAAGLKDVFGIQSQDCSGNDAAAAIQSLLAANNAGGSADEVQAQFLGISKEVLLSLVIKKVVAWLAEELAK